MKYYTEDGELVPSVTTDQMVEVDRLMIEKYNITLIQMMENAGSNLAKLLKRISEKPVKELDIIVAAGKGNNGGGTLVAARHLNNWGAKVTVLLSGNDLKEVPKHQLKILEKLPVNIEYGEDAINFLKKGEGDIVIDGLIGYGLKGDPRGWIKEIINGINKLETQVISLDVPSGLDATTGKIYEPCIKALATMTQIGRASCRERV